MLSLPTTDVSLTHPKNSIYNTIVHRRQHTTFTFFYQLT